MTHVSYNNSNEASQFLRACWQDGQLVERLSAQLTPPDLSAGYDVQEAFIQQQGWPVAGWKLGVASDFQVAQEGLVRGLVGQLLAPRCFSHDAHIQTPPSGALTLEFEVGIVLANDILPTEAYRVSNDDVAQVTFNFEVVRSRFVNRKVVGWPSFVADNAAFEAIVISEPVATEITPELLDKFRSECVLTLDGEQVSHALLGDKGINPLQSLQYLVDHARERGATLKKGQMVTTGALFAPFDIATRGHTVMATYGDVCLRVSI